MLRETLKSIVLSQQNWIVPDEKEIPRECLSRFTQLPPFSYLLTGVRRSGKSTLLRQIMRLHGSTNYFNFEDSRISGFELADFHALEAIFLEVSGGNAMLFFDEIQNVPEWERYVRDAVDRKKTLVITGSNAKLLSGELGARLTGRHLDHELYPFSYREFLSYLKLSPGAGSFSQYLERGGFPGYLEAGKGEMLSTLVSDILFRDIFTRYNLRNHEPYRRIVQFLLSNTGKEVSFNSLRNAFEIGSPSSVMEFMGYLTDAYLVFLVPRYDSSLKVQARNPRKVYAIDPGLAGFSSLSASPDHGRFLENTVFLHLKRTGMETWYHRGKRECDFICRRDKNSFSAYQVSWLVSPENEKRETEGLLEAMDRLGLSEGTIITFDQEDKLSKGGKTISLIPVWKWME